MAHLLPSGYTASYDPTIDHAQYAGEYLEPQETRASYSEDYYYAQNQPVYDATGHWQPSDQYNAEQDLADRYLNLQSAPSVASLAPWQAQGAVAEPYVQAYQGDDLAGSAATAVYWEGQHQSYSQAFPHQNTDDGPIHYPHHATHSQSPVHDPARYPYPAAQGYGFESTDSTPAASGDATSPQPVDQHDWGNSSRSGHGLESRLDFGHFQAPKYEASSAVSGHLFLKAHAAC
ncbi:hypothetical protein OE88DRAFT_1655296 [Heliocybe sulcata]|uniref:Uncharacterized protein n=1 Tax=Heliocybe sulcata TaxID=5364 RepID=A0A5C3NA50_9AGAM|nr:hypothetical protein OE88DRAFT_1655296 [Heliocybe sulcata]